MRKRKRVEFLCPNIYIGKGSRPTLFIDTYMWDMLFTAYVSETDLLKQCCEANAVWVVITNTVGGELEQRTLMHKIVQYCGHALVKVPVGRITHNQVIQALCCYMQDRKDVSLNWDLMISEVPVLRSQENGLKEAVSYLARELNNARDGSNGGKGNMVAALVAVERDVCRTNLKVYGQLLEEDVNRKRLAIKGRTYDRFFVTDYFTDLPAVMLQSYLFADVLKERNVKPQDVVDIYSLSELMPYTTIYIMDKDLHNRTKKLQQAYPKLFDRLDKMCYLSSYLRNSALSPEKALKDFLYYVGSRIQYD